MNCFYVGCIKAKMQMVEPGVRILEKYVLENFIGSGAFGEVWCGRSLITGELVAIKMENIQDNPAPTLRHECKVLQLFQGVHGFPRLRYFCQKDDMNRIFMVLDLLGPSLESVATSPRFSRNHETPIDNAYHAAFISEIGRQMLERLSSLHKNGLIHQDVKPENFLFSRDPELNLSVTFSPNANTPTPVPRLYLIDFGMTKRIKHEDEMIPKSNSKSLIGSARYASIASHARTPLSPKDDLISMMYALIYLANGGELPWMDCSHDEIYSIKMKMTPPELCSKLSIHHASKWTKILEILYNLTSKNVINYDELKQLM